MVSAGMRLTRIQNPSLQLTRPFIMLKWLLNYIHLYLSLSLSKHSSAPAHIIIHIFCWDERHQHLWCAADRAVYYYDDLYTIRPPRVIIVIMLHKACIKINIEKAMIMCSPWRYLFYNALQLCVCSVWRINYRPRLRVHDYRRKEPRISVHIKRERAGMMMMDLRVY